MSTLGAWGDLNYSASCHGIGGSIIFSDSSISVHGIFYNTEYGVSPLLVSSPCHPVAMSEDNFRGLPVFLLVSTL